MSNVNEMNPNTDNNRDESLLIDEFDVIELEDRLEMEGRCNISCGGDGGGGGGGGGGGIGTPDPDSLWT